MGGLLTWILGAAGAYVLWLVLLYLLQGSMIYPGRRIGERPPLSPDRAEREVIWLETSFGRVESWWLPPRGAVSGPTPAVVLAHGNAELIDTIPGGFLGFRDRGVGVLLVEYPGYGDSAGEPSVQTVTETVVAAFDALAARADVDSTRILGMGRSLGGGAVCALAAQRPLAGLVLVATFADLPSLSRRYLAPSSLATERYDNEAVLRRYDGPVFIAHGTRDELIPLPHAHRNAGAAARSTLRTYDARHDECPVDFDRFWADVDAWLTAEDVL